MTRLRSLVVLAGSAVLAYLPAPAFADGLYGSATWTNGGLQATVSAPGVSATVAMASVPGAGYAGAVVDQSPIDGAVWQGVGTSAASQVGCGAPGGAVRSAAGSVGTAQYVLVGPDGAVLGSVAVACATGPGGTSAPQLPPLPPTANQVWQSAVAWEPLVTSRIEVNPESTGLTGLSSWFWLSNSTTILPPLSLTVGGYSITASASIRSYTWLFGDGDQSPAYSPGSASEPASTDLYQTVGIYQVLVIAHYVGSYTISGNGMTAQTAPLQVSVTMGSLSYAVQEARSVLVQSGAG